MITSTYPASLSRSRNPWNLAKDSSMLSSILSSSGCSAVTDGPPLTLSGEVGDRASSNCIWCRRRLLLTSSSTTCASDAALARLSMKSRRWSSSISTLGKRISSQNMDRIINVGAFPSNDAVSVDL